MNACHTKAPDPAQTRQVAARELFTRLTSSQTTGVFLQQALYSSLA
jgi:hypothetical protein